MRLVKSVTWKEDGRKLIYFTFVYEPTEVDEKKGDAAECQS
jgi:hypothetical protein